MVRADALYRLSYWPTDRPVVKFLAMFLAAVPDNSGGKLNIKNTDGKQKTDFTRILHLSACKS